MTAYNASRRGGGGNREMKVDCEFYILKIRRKPTCAVKHSMGSPTHSIESPWNASNAM